MWQDTDGEAMSVVGGREVADVIREHLDICREREQERRDFGVHGLKAYGAIWAIQQLIREWMHDTPEAKTTTDLVDIMHERIHEIIDNEVPDFDALYH